MQYGSIFVIEYHNRSREIESVSKYFIYTQLHKRHRIIKRTLRAQSKNISVLNSFLTSSTELMVTEKSQSMGLMLFLMHAEPVRKVLLILQTSQCLGNSFSDAEFLEKDVGTAIRHICALFLIYSLQERSKWITMHADCCEEHCAGCTFPFDEIVNL